MEILPVLIGLIMTALAVALGGLVLEITLSILKDALRTNPVHYCPDPADAQSILTLHPLAEGGDSQGWIERAA